MEKDITFHFKQLREMHPNLYTYITPVQIDSIERQILHKCTSPLSLVSFNYILAQTNKYVDAHTGLFPDSFLPLLNKQQKNCFPPVTFTKDQIILNNIIIDSINGIPSSQFAKKMDLLVSWEDNPVVRQEQMNKYLSPVLYNIYHIEPPFICSRTNLPDTLIPPFSYKSKPPLPNHYTASSLTCQYFVKDSIAVLFYNSSLVFKGHKKFFTSFMKYFFQRLKKYHTQYLFIDVSQNGGGSDGSHKYILNFLKNKPYQYQSYIQATKKGALKGKKEIYKCLSGGKTSKELSRYEKWKIHQFVPEFLSLWKQLIKYGKAERTIINHGKKKGFNGHVFIIMSPHTFSAAHDFCEEIKRGQTGVLVGEASGQRSPFCGNIAFDKLPEMGLTFSYPTSYNWEEPALPYKDGFLQPDTKYPISGKFLDIEDYKKIIQLSKAVKNNSVFKRKQTKIERI